MVNVGNSNSNNKFFLWKKSRRLDGKLTKAEYNKTVNRAMAAAFLEDVTEALSRFRPCAELAGFKINERVGDIQEILFKIGGEIYFESMDQQRELT